MASSFSGYKVYISHAGEDKMTMAIPLREKLMHSGIKTFVDEKDMPGGTWAEEAMVTALDTVDIAVVIVSPEFVARKWPMKELLWFLQRCDLPNVDGIRLPIIIPLFYRLSIKELYDEPRLDRLDQSGNELYHETRFFERMKRGEPEASIATIKAALPRLHGFQGIENDFDASNENTRAMSKRRHALLNEMCEAVQNAMKRISEGLPQDIIDQQVKRGEFRCHFHEEDDVSDLVLDFQAKNVLGCPATFEAGVLKAVLDTSNGWNVISIQGMGGVGKTSIILALSNLEVVSKRFKDGIHLISLGADAARNSLTDALCEAVKVSGGGKKAVQMRDEKNWMNVFKDFRSWFSQKECLFMIDDVWETPEISSGVIHEVFKAHLSGVKSKVLVTTRNMEIASKANKTFVLNPYEPQDSRSRSILTLYSGIDVDETNDVDSGAVREILTKCSGLPLFLKIAGKAVKALSLRFGNTGCAAYHFYRRTLDVSMQKLLNTDVDSYERLASTLSESLRLVEYRLVEYRREWWGFETLTAPEMYRRLSVLSKKSRVPMKMLKYLWELASEAEATVVAREFEQIGLATIDVEKTDMGYVEFLRLHDSLHRYTLAETRRHGEGTLGHRRLLAGYSRGLEREGDCRAWWSRRLQVDGYVHKHLCRHLVLAGLEDELLSLVFKPEWTIRLLEIGGFTELEPGYNLCITLLKNVDYEICTGSPSDEVLGRREKAMALQLVLEAARLSDGFNAGRSLDGSVAARSSSDSLNVQGPAEICFQLYGRLNVFAEEYVIINNFLNRMEEKSAKPWVPWLRSINSFLAHPGGATTNIIYTGSPVTCMIGTEDGDRVICGCSDGRILFLDLARGRIEKDWQGHTLGIISIASCESKQLLLTGSIDDTAKLWNMETKSLIRRFSAYTSGLKCVAITNDGRRVLTGLGDGTVQVLDTETGLTLREGFRPHEKGVTCFAVLPDGELVVSGAVNKELRTWSLTAKEQEGSPFVGHDGCVTCVVTMPHRRNILSGSDDRTIRVWDVDSQVEVGDPFKGHMGPVFCAAVSSDERIVASGSTDRMILVWGLSSRQEVCKPLKGHTGCVMGVLFRPRNKSIISCSVDRTVRVWDIDKASIGRATDGHDKGVIGLTFTADGRYAISASLDHSVRVWDVKSGRQVGEPLLGHSHDVTGVAVTSDGQRILSVSRDMTLRVWDLESHKLLHTFQGHTDWIDDVAVMPSRDSAVTCSLDKTVRVWNLTTGDHYILGRYTLDSRADLSARLQISAVTVTDDGMRVILILLWGEIIVWTREGEYMKTERVKNTQTLGMSRKEVMDIVGEVCNEAREDISIASGDCGVWYVAKIKKYLGTLEAAVGCWKLSPDRKTICAGLVDGHVAFMRVETA